MSGKKRWFAIIVAIATVLTLALAACGGAEEAPITVPAGAQAGDLVVERGTYRLLLFGLAISGVTSFAYEIYWTRSLVFLLGNSTYAVTTMLSAFLVGLALGGYLVRFLVRLARDRVALFGWVQVLIGITAAVAAGVHPVSIPGTSVP